MGHARQDGGVPNPAGPPAVLDPEELRKFADTMSRLGDGADPAEEPANERHLVTFLVDGEEYGVPIQRVREILRVSAISRVPHAPPQIRGVTNVRGQVLPVVETRRCLGLEVASLTPRSRILLVEAHHRVVGLLVDGVSQVLKVPEKTIAPPEEFEALAADWIEGIVQLESRLIILLDLDRALQLQTV